MTWAPSWVTWRTYDNYCGWAPLPPAAIFTDSGFQYGQEFVGLNFDFGLSPECFTFVDFPHFFFHDFHHRHLPHNRVHQFFRHCRVINNFGIDRHKRIINHGVDVDHVAKFTGKRIDAARVIDAPRGSERFHQPREIMKNGRAEVVRTPLPAAPKARRTFIAQKADSQKAIVPSLPKRLESARPETPRTMTGVPATKGAENLNAPRVPATVDSTRRPGSKVNRFNQQQSGERERRPIAPVESSRTQTVNPPTRPEIRERSGAFAPRNEIQPMPRNEIRQPKAPPQRVTTLPQQNQPVQRFNQPVERFNQPVERINPPAQKLSPPVERINPPTERISPPVQRINPPVERIVPPVQRVPVQPGNAPAPSRPDRSFDGRRERGRP